MIELKNADVYSFKKNGLYICFMVLESEYQHHYIKYKIKIPSNCSPEFVLEIFTSPENISYQIHPIHYQEIEYADLISEHLFNKIKKNKLRLLFF